MNTDEIKASMQQQLEAVGVPTNQARDAANVLARQNVGELPFPLAPEHQHIVSSRPLAEIIEQA
jgi:hypothetical protein